MTWILTAIAGILIVYSHGFFDGVLDDAFGVVVQWVEKPNLWWRSFYCRPSYAAWEALQSQCQHLEQELFLLNQKLKNLTPLLNYQESIPYTIKTIEVFGVKGHCLWIQGRVSKNQAVATSHGVLGRVIDGGQHSGRVMLLTDKQSRVPVRHGEGGWQGLLEGQDSDELILDYNPEERPQTVVGDLLVTSGVGGVFPQGLPIARICRLDDKRIYAHMLVDLKTLTYGFVVEPPVL